MNSPPRWALTLFSLLFGFIRLRPFIASPYAKLVNSFAKPRISVRPFLFLGWVYSDICPKLNRRHLFPFFRPNRSSLLCLCHFTDFTKLSLRSVCRRNIDGRRWSIFWRLWRRPKTAFKWDEGPSFGFQWALGTRLPRDTSAVVGSVQCLSALPSPPPPARTSPICAHPSRTIFPWPFEAIA